MIIFLILLLKSIATFKNVATRMFEITYVAHSIFLLNSAKE